MARNIGAAGVLGVAFEVTPGTFVPATKFFPFTSETLSYKQETYWRRSIRAVADQHGAVAGSTHVAGDVTFECTEDVLVYFLHVSRNSVAVTGTSDKTYTTTPTHQGTTPGNKPAMSITIMRNSEAFGYAGCVVTGLEFTIDTGVLMCKVSIIGRDEATTADPTPTWPTTTPYGMDTHTLSIGGTPVYDTDSMTITIDDAGEPIFRLSSRSAVDIKWGERTVGVSCERDFDSRAEYDAFKAYTATAFLLVSSKGANNSIQIKVPVTIKETYDINLSGQGDLVRGSIQYNGMYDAVTSKAYEIIVKTQETIA